MRNLVLVVAVLLGACDAPQTSIVQVQVVQIARLGGLTDLEISYDCPADSKRLVRLDASFEPCGKELQVGDRIEAELVLRRSGERGTWQSQIVRLGRCAVHPDPNDASNFEMVQECRDLVVSGTTVGVECDRRRSAALLTACPFLRR